jgi:hypothetical protein
MTHNTTSSLHPASLHSKHQCPAEAHRNTLQRSKASPFVHSTQHSPPRTGEGTNPGMLSASATKQARASSTLRRSEGSLAAHCNPISIMARWVSAEAHVTATTPAKLSANQHNTHQTKRKPKQERKTATDKLNKQTTNETNAQTKQAKPHAKPVRAPPRQCGTGATTRTRRSRLINDGQDEGRLARPPGGDAHGKASSHLRTTITTNLARSVDVCAQEPVARRTPSHIT